MNRISMSVAALLACSTAAVAGGLDRSGQSVAILFEEGNRVELSFGAVNPTVSGTYAGLANAGSGDIAPSFTTYTGAMRMQMNDKLAFGLIFDQPFGADVLYPTTGTTPLAGTSAEFSSSALTALVQYDVNNNVSVYGGIKRQSVAMSVAIPGGGALNYVASGQTSEAYGYVVGAAYEIPEIALRAALTYHSAISHDITTIERSAFTGGVDLAPSTTNVKTPKSVNLDFQTGIAADTLLMASVRYVDWTETVIAPAHNLARPGGGVLQSYSEPSYTWNLGMGRKFSDAWSGSVSFGYEQAQGGTTGNLAPTDGFRSIALGAKYAADNMDVSAGIQYRQIGDATSTGAGGANGTFTGNSAVSMGVKVGFSF